MSLLAITVAGWDADVDLVRTTADRVIACARRIVDSMPTETNTADAAGAQRQDMPLDLAACPRESQGV